MALDARGHLAAATSTGGITNQAPGRVGDSALPGAGTWADDRTCAVSATGRGELFIRCTFARQVDVRVAAGAPLAEAVRLALLDVLSLGGRGGCIAISASGDVSLSFSTDSMYRGLIDSTRLPRVAVFSDETPGASACPVTSS